MTFDAAVIEYHSGKRKVDVFAMSQIISKTGVLDDQSFKDIIIGAYASERIVPHKLLLD